MAWGAQRGGGSWRAEAWRDGTKEGTEGVRPGRKEVAVVVAVTGGDVTHVLPREGESGNSLHLALGRL